MHQPVRDQEYDDAGTAGREVRRVERGHDGGDAAEDVALKSGFEDGCMICAYGKD